MSHSRSLGDSIIRAVECIGNVALAAMLVLALSPVFAEPANAQSYTLTTLYSFAGSPDGEWPLGIVLDAQGNLYGTTTYGGQYGFGTVFKVNPSGNETVLYSFRGAGVGDGASPVNGLTRDSQGDLYGTTLDGGTGNCDDLAPGCGTVFKLSASGQETVLYRFTGANGDGYPYSTLILDSAGNIYGLDGIEDTATAFKIDSSGHETVIYSFYRESPAQLLAVPGQQGSFYGVIYQNFLANPGATFKLTPSGQR